MLPITVIINGTQVQPLSALPAVVTHFEIVNYQQCMVDPRMSAFIKQWLDSIYDRLDCEYVNYLGTLIPISDLQKFST